MSNFTRPLKYDTLGKGWYRLQEPVILYFTLGEVYRSSNKSELNALCRATELEPDDVIFIKAPVGFRTDFASIPKVFQWLFKPDGKHAKAAVIHDLLYQHFGELYVSDETIPSDRLNKFTDRRFADLLFALGMRILDVNLLQRGMFYHGVSMFGGASYQAKRTGVTDFDTHHNQLEVVTYANTYAVQYPLFTMNIRGGSIPKKPGTPGINAVRLNSAQHGMYITPVNFGRSILTLEHNRIV